MYTYRDFSTNAPDPPSPVGLVPAWPDPWDPDIVRNDPYPVLLSQVKRSRQGPGGAPIEFIRQFWYCGQSGQPGCPTEPTNDAGRPRLMAETGHFSRTTTVTYRHTFGDGVYLRGVPTSQAVSVGSETFTTTDTYSDLGFLSARDVFGVVTTYAPTGAGNLASVTDARQFTTALTWDWGVRKQTQTPEYTIQRTINPDGTIQSVTQNGVTTTFEYDALGRQTRIHPPIGLDTVTTYAEDGTWVRVARGDAWTRTDLDGFGRAVHTENSRGIHTETKYDAIGRTLWVRAPWDSTHPQERKTWFAYDVWDRVILKTNPDTSTVSTVYSVDAAGLQTTITDEKGHVTTQVWHATGSPDTARLHAVTDADTHTSEYEYNALGSLTMVTSPGGVLRTWTYNTKNQLASQTQPELGTVTYGYDAVGNLEAQTDAKNQTIGYTYDGNNRLKQVTAPASHQASSVSITYDAANNRRTVSNGFVSTTFDYDAANRLTRRADVVGGRTFVSTYTLDGSGNVVDVQYPSSNRVQYAYDSENRISAVSDTGRGLTFASTITYHPAGGLTGYTSGDGAAHSISYDERQRPAQISATGVANLPALTYSYDDVGNVTAIGDARQGFGATFTYDALDRLKTAGGVWGAVEYLVRPAGEPNAEDARHGDDILRLHVAATDGDHGCRAGHVWLRQQREPDGGSHRDLRLYADQHAGDRIALCRSVVYLPLRWRQPAHVEAPRIDQDDLLPARARPGVVGVRGGERPGEVDRGLRVPRDAVAGGSAAVGVRNAVGDRREGRLGFRGGDERARGHHLRRDLQCTVAGRRAGDADGDG